MEIFLLLLELAAIALQVAIIRLVGWIRTLSAEADPTEGIALAA